MICNPWGDMQRREFITFTVGSVGSYIIRPSHGFAKDNHRVVGLFTVALDTRTELIDAFRNGLRKLGYFPGVNLTLDFKSTNGKAELLDSTAAEIVKQDYDVVVTWGTLAVSSIQKASKTVPVVMASIGDPVAVGIVTNIARPGGNITGFTLASLDTIAKRLQMFKEFVPNLKRIGYLLAPDTGMEIRQFQEIEAAAKTFDMEAKSFVCLSAAEIKSAINSAAAWKAGGLITSNAALFAGHRADISNLSLEHRIPLASPTKEFPAAGALFSYGPSITDLSRRAATYVDKILKGESPAVLPIQHPDKFELVINLKTARTLGLVVPPALFAAADEVIE